MGFKFKDNGIITRMPHIGDIVVKDRGEVKDNFIVIKEYKDYFLAVSQRLKFRECFSKASFALKELKIQRRENFIKEGAVKQYE
ncbi:hypothetical protein ACJDT4_13855 [Clostridium neuense]|uniref:Uncharacterized protein n=1 Tax=Clostridium neuense TaxID=1728934 RepID=A0ABW8TH52_9CLOT